MSGSFAFGFSGDDIEDDGLNNDVHQELNEDARTPSGNRSEQETTASVPAQIDDVEKLVGSLPLQPVETNCFKSVCVNLFITILVLRSFSPSIEPTHDEEVFQTWRIFFFSYSNSPVIIFSSKTSGSWMFWPSAEALLDTYCAMLIRHAARNTSFSDIIQHHRDRVTNRQEVIGTTTRALRCSHATGSRR